MFHIPSGSPGLKSLYHRMPERLENRCSMTNRKILTEQLSDWCFWDMATLQTSRKRTQIFRQFSYGVGHVMNDATRLLVQSFRLVFLMKVVNLSASNAGWILIFSRVTNAFILKPLVGYLCDKVSIPILSRSRGERKSWHFIGTVIQAISVPLLFSNCLVCSSDSSQWHLIVYYGTFNTLVWLSMCLIEVAHLSIVPFIAKDQKEAVKLNGLRMTLAFLAGIVSFLVAFAILGKDNRDHLTAESSMDFTVITLILMGGGLVFAGIFQIGTKEPKSDKQVKRKVPSHKQVTDDKTNGPEEVESSEVNKCVKKSWDSNKNEHQASNGEHLREAEEKKKTVVSNDKHCDAEKPCSDSEALPLAVTKSLGVENKGFDCNEVKSTLCSPDQVTVRTEDEVDKSDVVAKSMEQNHSVTVLETLNNKKPFVASSDLESALVVSPRPKTVRAWLKDPHLYKVAIIFACTRLLQDVSYSYLPLFLTDRLNFQKEAIANLPLVVLISAMVSAGISKKVIGKMGSKWSFIMAALSVIGSCVWFYFITQSTRVLTYPAAALLGFGFSAMYVNAYSFTTELIGDNKSNSGFVFSFLGIAASLIGGVLIGVIQNLFPKKSESAEGCEECGNYSRHVLSLVPGSLAFISLLIVLIFQTSCKARKQNVSKTDVATQTDETLQQTDTSMETEIIATEQ